MEGTELYILKHKDLDVAMVKISPFSGRIEYILEVCKISEETKIAREYGKRANRTVMIKNRRHENI